MTDSPCSLRSRVLSYPASRLGVTLGLLLPGLLLVLGGVSCHAPTKDLPVMRVVEADNERVLWNALRIAIYEEKFQVGGAGADASARSIKSAWKLDLTPFRGTGPRARKANRSRVIVTYDRFDGDRDSLPSGMRSPAKLNPLLEPYAITMRVEVENNDSLRPMDLRFAEWVPADDDPTVAERIFLKLAVLLGTSEFKLSEEDEAPFRLE